MNIDEFITDLLHIGDVADNRLLNLEGDKGADTYYVYHPLKAEMDFLSYLVTVAKERNGKSGNTVLRKSAKGVNEQTVGLNVNFLDWKAVNGANDARDLDKYIEKTYKELKLKGNNPLVMGVGGLRWVVALNDKETQEIISPILVYPVRLIRSGGSSPVMVEFVDDEVYVNPCLIAKLKELWGEELALSFPHPNGDGVDLDDPVDREKLATGEEYFEKVRAYIERCALSASEGTIFRFESIGAITRYNHNELCSYYDIRRNREKIDSHPVVDRIFNKRPIPAEKGESSIPLRLILPYDNAQKKMISRIVNGESLVVKGPPGSGKTLTIANVVAALLAADKKVLLASQKLAALTEVYAKLPEKIRKFVMLLESETEEAAARLNPTSVKADLNELLRQRREYKKDSRAYERYENARDEQNQNNKFLHEYVTDTFVRENVAGVSYYEAIDRFCKKELKLLRFTEPEKAANLSREEYTLLENDVTDAAGYFSALTDGLKTPIEKSPWFPLRGHFLCENVESVLEKYKEIALEAESVLNGVKEILADVEGYEELLLADYIALSRYAFSPSDTEKAFSGVEKDSGLIENVTAALAAYAKGKAESEVAKFSITATGERLEELANAMQKIVADDRLLLSDWKILYENREILLRVCDVAVAAKCCIHLEKIVEAELVKAKYKEEVLSVFKETLSKEEKELIEKASESLEKYATNEEEKPFLFDIKAKWTINKLLPLSYLKDVSFKELVKGVVAYKKYEESESLIEGQKSEISRLLRLEVTDCDLKNIAILLEKSTSSKKDPKAYLQTVVDSASTLQGALAVAEKIGGGEYTVKELKDAYRGYAARERIVKAAKDAASWLGVSRIPDKENAEEFFLYLSALAHFLSVEGVRGKENWKRVELAQKIAKEGDKIAQKAEEVLKSFRYSNEEFFPTYYGEYYDKVSFADLEIFLLQARNRSVLNAAARYLEIVSDEENELSLEEFFRYFEKDLSLLKEGSFEEYFEHAVFGLAIEHEAGELGSERNGRGDNVTLALEDWNKRGEELRNAQIDLIEEVCMDRIDPNDPDFAFLAAERAVAGSLRMIFKQNAKGLMKLKKCFLLSPYSVSVLFRNKAFDDFDVVIMDEASQLTPTGALPAIFRSKQCVLVGDEHQMPPIRHFESRTEKKIVDEDGEEYELQADVSVLSLALTNGAFPFEKLSCHYRSKTESLIAFSQKRYYPDMRTFPCPEPKGEGVGLVDAYVADGCISDSKTGVNEKEAEEVLRRLNLHFAKYYDEEKGVLRESVGVVAFGEAQLKEIRALVNRDKELRAKIEKAEENFSDPIKEKLIFFKTIEKVQGQETEHLILSLTYGRKADGKLHQRFGELNNGTLGECIFNVAVTRAKSSVTVVHSVKASEITNEKISFIKEYLEVVERFGAEATEDFVCLAPKEGFLRSVGEYILSLGVEKERVVYDYGVTEGSVKIPIVLLSKDRKKALLGIWCERPYGTKYMDYNARYYTSLCERGWKLMRVFAHDWIDNGEEEKKRLLKAISPFI